MPDLKTSYPEKNVISPSDIVSIMNLEGEQITISKKPEILPISKRRIFAAMPFEPKYDDTYFVAMKKASAQAGFDCGRVDEDPRTGDIVKLILKMIEECEIVIVDLSESKPNVLYELGFAEGINRKIIQICSTPLVNMPFDVSHNKTIEYQLGQTNSLKRRILEVLGIFPRINICKKTSLLGSSV